jgi:hypothetical protein
VSRRQARRWGAQEEQQPDEQMQDSSDGVDSQMDQLERLGKLHEQGVLTDEEFRRKKQQILG